MQRGNGFGSGASPLPEDSPQEGLQPWSAGVSPDQQSDYPTGTYPTQGVGYQAAGRGAQFSGPAPVLRYEPGTPGPGVLPGRSGQSGRGAMTATLFVVVFLALTVSVAAFGINSLFHSVKETVIAAPSPTATLELEEPGELYVMSERPGYLELEARLGEIREKYIDVGRDEILQRVPLTEDGLNYYQDFVYILTDLEEDIDHSGSVTGTDPKDLDLTIAANEAKLTELERKFLAYEPFGVELNIVRADGTVYTSTGTEAPLSREKAEEFARSYVAAPDANGSYADAAQAAIKDFGLYLTWDDEGYSDLCGPVEGAAMEEIGATYCMADPDLIYVNTSSLGYPDNLYDSSFVDLIKHETAHSIIGEICGTLAPPVAGADFEGVTSSYAVLYLGADRTVLSSWGDWKAQYAVTPATDAAAAEIHEGRCG
jgi:hypothetical protein